MMLEPAPALARYGLVLEKIPNEVLGLVLFLASGWGTGYFVIGVTYVFLSRKLWSLGQGYASGLAIVAMLGSFFMNQKMASLGWVPRHMVRHMFVMDSLVLALNAAVLFLITARTKVESAQRSTPC